MHGFEDVWCDRKSLGPWTIWYTPEYPSRGKTTLEMRKMMGQENPSTSWKRYPMQGLMHHNSQSFRIGAASTATQA